MTNSELKLCPFCGCKASFHEAGGTYLVRCSHCCVATDEYSYKQDAGEAWNNRVQQNAEIELRSRQIGKYINIIETAIKNILGDVPPEYAAKYQGIIISMKNLKKCFKGIDLKNNKGVKLELIEELLRDVEELKSLGIQHDSQGGYNIEHPFSNAAEKTISNKNCRYCSNLFRKKAA